MKVKGKRIVSIFLVFCLVIGLSLGNYQRVQATGYDFGVSGWETAVTGLGALLGGMSFGTAAFVIFGLVGITVTVANYDSIADAGNAMWEDFTTYIDEVFIPLSKTVDYDPTDDIDRAMDNFVENLYNGIISKSSVIWEALLNFKEYIQSSYLDSAIDLADTTTGMLDIDLSDYTFENGGVLVEAGKSYYSVIPNTAWYYSYDDKYNIYNSDVDTYTYVTDVVSDYPVYMCFVISSNFWYNEYSNKWGFAPYMLLYSKGRFEVSYSHVLGYDSDYTITWGCNYNSSLVGFKAYYQYIQNSIIYSNPVSSSSEFYPEVTYGTSTSIIYESFSDAAEMINSVIDSGWDLVWNPELDLENNQDIPDTDEDEDTASTSADIPDLQVKDWTASDVPEVEIDTVEDVIVLNPGLDVTVDDIESLIESISEGVASWEDLWDLVEPATVDTNDIDTVDTDTTEITTPDISELDNSEFLLADLEKVFPFCIPFDIYKFFKCLCAPPKAPVIRWKFYIMGETYSLKINLKKWDDVAELLRLMELMAFIVGLAFVTRDKLIKS